jgi:integrase/recombinase XerC
MTVREALEKWVLFLRASQTPANTIKAYEKDVRHLCDWLELAAPEAAADVRALNDVRLLRKWLGARAAAGAAPSSRARAVSALRRWELWLARAGAIDARPAGELVMPRIVRELPTFLHAGDADRLCEAPAAASKGTALERALAAALIEVGYGSGLRVSELCGLDVEDLDLRQRMVHVRNGKGRRERFVPLTRKSVAAVRTWLLLRADLLAASPLVSPVDVERAMDAARALFLSNRRRRLSVRAAQDLVKRWGKRALGRDLSPHSLRHSCATSMMKGGADLRVIQTMLGHSNIRSTTQYTHTDTAWLQEVHRACHPTSRVTPPEAQLELPLDDAGDARHIEPAPLAKTTPAPATSSSSTRTRRHSR